MLAQRGMTAAIGQRASNRPLAPSLRVRHRTEHAQLSHVTCATSHKHPSQDTVESSAGSAASETVPTASSRPTTGGNSGRSGTSNYAAAPLYNLSRADAPPLQQTEEGLGTGLPPVAALVAGAAALGLAGYGLQKVCMRKVCSKTMPAVILLTVPDVWKSTESMHGSTRLS